MAVHKTVTTTESGEAQILNLIFHFVYDFPNRNIWCEIICNQVVGLFMLAEKTITGATYLYMLDISSFFLRKLSYKT